MYVALVQETLLEAERLFDEATSYRVSRVSPPLQGDPGIIVLLLCCRWSLVPMVTALYFLIQILKVFVGLCYQVKLPPTSPILY